jgi:hypothetical protein
LAASVAACSVGGPDVIPFEGAAPRTILVLPPRSTVADATVGTAFAATAGTALRGRGYYPIPIEAGWSMLEARGLSPQRRHDIDALAAAGRALGADALLSIRIEKWDARWAPALIHLEYDIGHRLWDTATGDVIWELRSQDRWDWNPNQMVTFDSSLDSYLGAVPDQGQSPYRHVTDVARVLQEGALARLPLAGSK